jgi:peroxiredoxin Q/BCP
MTLKENDKAPDFHLPSTSGKNISLKDFAGKKNVVLYFYPKDDTPGCTVEACGLRDQIKGIEKLDAVVLGVSPDSVKSHDKFVQKFNLPFDLVSDEEKNLCNDYGVWIEKSMYGRKYMGVNRATFIIDKKGRIAKIFPKVTPKGHEQEVIDALKTLT